MIPADVGCNEGQPIYTQWTTISTGACRRGSPSCVYASFLTRFKDGDELWIPERKLIEGAADMIYAFWDAKGVRLCLVSAGHRR